MPSARHPIRTAVCVRPLPGVPEPTAVLEALGDAPYRWLLDSALRMPGLGRFSFAGAAPYAVLRTFGEQSTLDVLRAVRPDLSPGRSHRAGDPFALVRALLPPPPSLFRGPDPGGLPFVGGAVGYLGYELAEQLEALGLTARDDLGLPDQVQLFVDRLVAVDHAEGRAFAVGLGFAADARTAERRSERACGEIAKHATRAEALHAPAPLPVPAAGGGPPRVPEGVDCFFDEASYAQAVEKVGRHIAAGEVYQANLTHRMEQPLAGVLPFDVYHELRRTNPAPFAAYLELPELALLSSSPERFLSLDGERRVESRPIKGTRPRGATPEEDVLLAKELEASEKDCAENLMIVDLVRNDLGRVCETGSVAVPQLRAVERYATVFQLVSSVTGRLRGDRDGLDLVRACFPPGSMTGAPKIAAMRLLDGIEPVRRGAYAGALGYLDVRGGLDLSVVIRTLLVKDGRAYLHVGGGVVADSDPVAEYRETLDKARALLAVLPREPGRGVC